MLCFENAYCWGFYGHSKINYCAVFLLPPEMMILYKPNIQYLTEHATDPDKRRYAVEAEAPRHYIDLDFYGERSVDSLPRNWSKAVDAFTLDSLNRHGIVPWHIQLMLTRLTEAFKQKNYSSIMKNSAEIGHYIADAHVPLHTTSNYNGQKTNQTGIHGFWESRVPELLAENEFNFFIGKASYIKDPTLYIWTVIKESNQSVDSVLYFEKALTNEITEPFKFSFENRNGKIIKQYSSNFTKMYSLKLNGMIERRMHQSIFTIASFWYTAWVNAGQPDLQKLTDQHFNQQELLDFEVLNETWRKANSMIGREE